MTEAELIAEEIQKYNNPCGRAAKLLLKQQAEIAALKEDKALLDWLNENIFHRENVDWITGKLSTTCNMWVTFAPLGVQGSARNILRAAKERYEQNVLRI